jgi:hypothetical protein
MVVLSTLYYNMQWICKYYAVSSLFWVLYIVLSRGHARSRDPICDVGDVAFIF